MNKVLDGVECRFEDEARPRVVWMSDWARADELVTLGLLDRKHYGPSTYGHVDYFVKF